MIIYEKEFIKWLNKNIKENNQEKIEKHQKDLNIISILIGENISEKNLYNKHKCILNIERKLKRFRSNKSIDLLKPSLILYAEMIIQKFDLKIENHSTNKK